MGNTIKYIKGDLVRDAERDYDVIGHGCNCWCTMGAGIALGVKQKWRRAYDADTATAYGDSDKLGTYSSWNNDDITVLNLYTQWNYKGSNGVKADYDAIRNCMILIRDNFSGQKIGLPLIGAGLAGGDWKIIEQIIKEELEGEDVTVVVWERSKVSWEKQLLRKENVQYNKIAVMETWTESEADWGTRPDGVSLHLTKEDYESFTKEYWNDNGGGSTPAEYSREDGRTQVVNVTDDVYKEIEETKNGLRLIQNPKVLESEGKIKLIL